MADQTLAFDWAGASAARQSDPCPTPERRLSPRERFPAYDRANPGIWEAFDRFAWELVHAGRTRLSAGLIFERIRWETAIRARGCAFKANNDFRACYARRWNEENPDAGAAFETRVQRAEAS